MKESHQRKNAKRLRGNSAYTILRQLQEIRPLMPLIAITLMTQNISIITLTSTTNLARVEIDASAKSKERTRKKHGPS